MGDTTGISWTEATWNPWMGCTKVSAGCDYCYMFREQRQYGNDPEAIRRSKTKFDAPLKMDGSKLIFTCSWSDFFHVEADQWRDEAWDIIRRTPQHTYQVLTKRPGRILRNLPDDWGDGYPNVWLGVSVETAAVLHRVDQLRKVSAALRFISAEPLLGSLFTTASQVVPGDGVLPPDPTDVGCSAPDGDAQDDAQSGADGPRPNAPLDLFDGIGWVIVGGESGPKDEARPMHPRWAREIRDVIMERGHTLVGTGDLAGDERRVAEHIEGVFGLRPAFHMKQWGSWAPDDSGRADAWFVLPDGARCTRMYADAHDVDLEGAYRMYYAGGAPGSGGKFLDGRDWCEIPERYRAAVA